ncbi:tRNA 4-thiouridine(8) synthase ThiI [Pyrococcus furiosus DSM 3638]|uniref:Thiamin biosynthesis protein thiI n=3 Tax=Pyrococcus furiosus TaxID=2261 RepID=Q8U0U5_PYRFU|nr:MULTISPECIES: tRNA 4-thiouridine(8) synthase ThiI [Pyrococcus]AAL81611.1 putative thiamin biosynthesis protein thiI [Pyrococcus furiosus DSM 3638]AFN04270.1 thiamine biosynthesis protein ThiI [Pyrococcus furiosus COM1]MDK2870617.1 tRNA uracil 4-sulfurtransferase [Pyrococcus sp.]QEK79114.1 tRNA 4-thiouridine(8) synthase ThiI [Pyrococcus furiosus DSM 3638]
MNSIIVRYGEMGTKSRQTRKWFERILVNNISEALVSEGIEYKEVFSKHGRVIVRLNEVEKAKEVLPRVFGIVSISPAMEVEASLDKINKTALKLFRKKKRELGIEKPKFRVTARRITKEFPLNSIELQAKVGEFILESEDGEVDLTNYDIEVGIELMEGKAYIYTEKIYGWGGLPIGTQGKMVGILDSIEAGVAIFLMMKRGVEVIPVYVEGQGDEDLVRTLWRNLKKYSYGAKVRFTVVKNFESINDIIRHFGAKGVIRGIRKEVIDREIEEIIRRDAELFIVPVYYPVIAIPDEIFEKVRNAIYP